jgi:hypothetical protein
MTRKTVTGLVDFTKLCTDEMWRTSQALITYELAIQLAIARDASFIDEIRNRLGVENSND